MGILTHHIADANVHNNQDGTAFVWSALDDGVCMEITPSGYLQPPADLRARRFLIAVIVGFAVLWVRWVLAGSMDIDTFFDVQSTQFPTVNTTLVLMAFGVWLSALHLLIFQRVYLFGNFPGWHFVNSLMMAMYFIVVGLVSVLYLGLMIVTIIQWIGQLLGRDRRQ